MDRLSSYKLILRLILASFCADSCERLSEFWTGLSLSRTYSCMHSCMHSCMYVWSIQSFKRPTVVHCLFNQVRLDPLTITISLLVTRVSALRARDMYFSRYTRLETNATFVSHRTLMVYFSLAKASKITFHHNLLDTSMSLGAASSYTRINRNLTSTPEKKGKNMQRSLTNLYQASSGFPINSKHEVWRFYCRFASSAHKSCANSLRGKEMFGKCRGDAGGEIEPRCFDSPFWDSVRDTQIRCLCVRVARYYDNPDAYSRRNDGHGS